jgi:dTDP-4-amino-4,6-dideoxygalactose transaminase
MEVPYVNLARQYADEREAVLAAVEAVLASGQWVGGPQVEAFEHDIAAYCGARHAVGVGSGTDALVLSMRALDIGPGAEVITPPNSFVASTASIVFAGAQPVFVDVLPDQNLDPNCIEAAITPRTKAIMPVHLTGRTARMDQVMEIARRHGLYVIEDAAQSIGARFKGQLAGTFGDVGCFSAHPLKNLNAVGDAGFVVTNNDQVAQRLRRLRNNGLVDRNTVAEWGVVSRLDTVQAAVLSTRLKGVDDIIEKRRANAALYRSLLDSDHVFMPPCGNDEYNIFHTFVVQVDRRDELQAHLAKKGIGTAIHYPVPIHLQPAAAKLGYRRGDFTATESQAERILSLPINQYVTPDDIGYVADTVNGFYV